MLVLKSTASLLLLFAAIVHAANNPVPPQVPPNGAPKVAASSQATDKAPAIADVNIVPGSVDAPVDGLDGKPHTGPGLFETKGKGTGDVGISGGTLHVDLKNPPLHTGEHEIVGLEDKDDPDTKSKQKPSVEQIDDNAEKDPSLSGGPVPDREHKEYIQPGTDTLKDPPINEPAHLKPIQSSPETSAFSEPMHSFGLSFIMIIFSEVGDKTFLIAALMAMKHPRILVFTAALSSLIVMSILSALLGHAVPTLIPPKFTAFLAAGLFAVFGFKMIKEGLEMEKGTANVQHEMAEVEAELQEKSRDRASSLSRKLESGTLSTPSSRTSRSLRRNTSSPSLSDSDEDDYATARGMKGKKVGFLEGIQNLAGLLLAPAWVQTFVMTFLGEWGDRSQIATIAMAAGQDYWYVTLGAISGHAICTGIAVIGGRMLASKISVRNVTLGGAVAFLVFAVLYLVEALYS